jgi:glycosyltransferase involved in cell wall biosynthesis
MRIAFHTPMKKPGHPTPSGDQQVAALYRQALAYAGHEVLSLSEFQSYEGNGDEAAQIAIISDGEAEAARLIAMIGNRRAAARPDAWFTYHLYYKAPDFLGPAVARAFGLPYLVAEASFAGKRANGPFARFQQEAVKGIAAADALFCPTRLDMEPLARIAPRRRIHYLPPFLDPAAFLAARQRREAARVRVAAQYHLDTARPWLLAVGMMRQGDKLASYAALGQALIMLPNRNFELLVVGDGPARPDVERHLAPLGPRLHFLGARPWHAMPDIYAVADLALWPAVNEAYGMALLEAAAAGLAVVAGDVRGVPEVVRDGETGLLARPGDSADFAAKVDRLLGDSLLRKKFAAASVDFVAGERNLAQAATILDHALKDLPGAALMAGAQ